MNIINVNTVVMVLIWWRDVKRYKGMMETGERLRRKNGEVF